jgi:hypothetical protein
MVDLAAGDVDDVGALGFVRGKIAQWAKPDCKKGGMMLEYKKAPEICCGGQVKMVCENQNER